MYMYPDVCTGSFERGLDRVSYKYKTNNHDSLALENEFSFHDYSRHVEHHCLCCSEWNGSTILFEFYGDIQGGSLVIPTTIEL